MGLLVFAPGAVAATRYVATTGSNSANSCLDAAAPCETIQHAAEVATGGDTIQIAAGEYEGLSTVPTTALNFVGAGAGTLADSSGATVIRGASGASGESGSPALVLDKGGSISSLRAEGGEGAASGIPEPPQSGGTAISLFGPAAAGFELDDVIAIGGTGGRILGILPAFGGFGLNVLNGPLAVVARDSTFVAGEGLTGSTAAMFAGAGVDVAVEDSRALGGAEASNSVGIDVGQGASATFARSSIEARIGVFVSQGRLSLERSRVQSIAGDALQAGPEGAASASLELSDSLLVSPAASAVDLLPRNSGATASLDARGTTLISHGGPAALVANAAAGSTATADLRNSIVRQIKEPGEPTTDLQADGGAITADFSSFTSSEAVNGGSVPAPGSASNLAGDPGFLDPTASDFSLRGDSPLIDRGDAATAAPDELDLAGAPRSLDGDRDCVARPDIGAYEVTGQSATCPTTSKPTPPPPVDPPPVVSAFRMTNRAFAPTGKSHRPRHGAKSARKRGPKRGTRFTYTLSEPATVEIAIEWRPHRHKRAHASKIACLRQMRGRRSVRPCSAFVEVTTLTKQGGAGPQSVPFSGRVNGRPLPAGRYRAKIVATDTAGQHSPPHQLGFRILGRK